jgi:hypothetical protein
MDPNETLRQVRAIIENEEVDSDDLLRLRDLTESLDKWISGGGILPDAWQLPGIKALNELKEKLPPPPENTDLDDEQVALILNPETILDDGEWEAWLNSSPKEKKT